MGPLLAVVVFSHNLELGPLEPLNWFVRFGDLRYGVLAANVLGGNPANVVLSLLAPLAAPGPDVVSYSPPPFDVISDTFKPTTADAFTDFPLHA